MAVTARAAEVRPVRHGPSGYRPPGRGLLAIRWRLLSGLRWWLLCLRGTARAELCALGFTMPGDDLRPGVCRLDEREMRLASAIQLDPKAEEQIEHSHHADGDRQGHHAECRRLQEFSEHRSEHDARISAGGTDPGCP